MGDGGWMQEGGWGSHISHTIDTHVSSSCMMILCNKNIFRQKGNDLFYNLFKYVHFDAFIICK